MDSDTAKLCAMLLALVTVIIFISMQMSHPQNLSGLTPSQKTIARFTKQIPKHQPTYIDRHGKMSVASTLQCTRAGPITEYEYEDMLKAGNRAKNYINRTCPTWPAEIKQKYVDTAIKIRQEEIFNMRIPPVSEVSVDGFDDEVFVPECSADGYILNENIKILKSIAKCREQFLN